MTDQNAAAEGATTTAPDERYKKVTHPETGQLVNRKDYILELYQVKKMSRGDIARHLSEITGKKVAYQVVFATTKGKPGGPDKVAPAETAAVAE